MSCKYTCDACGKEAAADTAHGQYFKPYHWFQRGDADGVQDACSRPCIEKIAAASGKTGVVLPL